MDTPNEVLEGLDEAYAEIDEDRLDGALEILEALLKRFPDAPEVHYLKGEVHLRGDDMEAGSAALAKAVALDPEYADAHHLLARAYEELERFDDMVAHDLKVLALDEAADAALEAEFVQEALRMIEGQAEEVLAHLPEPFRARLAEVPVMLEPRPTKDMVSQGFDPRALGLFEGPTDEERHSHEPPPAPTRIVLFWTNLLDVAEDDDSLAEEVEVTVLHEVAHYFGLDEAQVAALGLE